MKLFEPIRIGAIEVQNRLVMAPMTTHFGAEGYVSDQMIRFYERRARGGVGLISVEDGIVDCPIGNNTDHPLAIDSDRYLPGLAKLAAGIRNQGAASIMQISHAGRRAGQIASDNGCLKRTGGRLPVAPSALAHPSPGHVVPKPLAADEIQNIITRFEQSAERAVRAGFDMIGLHCAHMYLCGQFLSPWSNKRTDEYGGSLENRMRFVLEIVKRIRTTVGANVPIVCRMNGKEPEGGNTPEELAAIAVALEHAGADALHISVGFASVLWDKDFIPAEATIGMPEGCIVDLAAAIKRAVSIPVIAVNKIRHVQFAEQVLQENKADMIALGRPLLADPDWPLKARQNRAEDIRPCISCCQGCVGNIEKGRPITCMSNPQLGRENELPMSQAQAARKKKVLIVGAGPAGLEAALGAATRGHNVTIWERNQAVGGKLQLAAAPPGKEEFTELLDYLDRAARKQGVKIALGKKADSAAIKRFGPDVVVLATGSRPVLPAQLKFCQGASFIPATEVIGGYKPIGPTVAIIGGGMVGLETAKMLSSQGHAITVFEMLDDIGTDMPAIIRIPLLLELREKGVKLLPRTPVRELSAEGISWENERTRGVLKVDTIILATGEKPDDGLQRELEGVVERVYLVGDCKRPGNMPAAIADAYSVGLEI
ncbi:MAG: FAD-dependent oxidoreductase [Deltaproteobacteria bacterium]|nr:FAD-dependent oxidoreductase [Deltaproteobacteria bacterium]MBF0507438.1 FAD-dependent oxidoreductase [Deltaproteobacteria bacterium]MBF0523844.1 FAD-dependent oxidoreductase [Deltaproteobacteria bacterium]